MSFKILSSTTEITLMDANYTVDEHLSTRTIELTDLPLFKETVCERVSFNDVSSVFPILFITINAQSYHHLHCSQPGCYNDCLSTSLAKLACCRCIPEPHPKKICFLGFSTRSNTNQALQPQKIAGGLKFWI